MSIKATVERIRRAKVKDVTIDGETFYLGKIGADESCDFSDFQATKPKALDSMTRLVRLALVDKNGVRVLASDADEADLRSLPLHYLMTLFEAAAQFNGMNEGAVEELEGKSDGAQPAGSPAA
jgi:hypothetical protein